MIVLHHRQQNIRIYIFSDKIFSKTVLKCINQLLLLNIFSFLLPQAFSLPISSLFKFNSSTFSTLFPKGSFLVAKKIDIIFVALYCVSQICNILFQAGHIDIFVFRSVFFKRYVKLKSSFPDEKTSGVKSETHVRREAIGN